MKIYGNKKFNFIFQALVIATILLNLFSIEGLTISEKREQVALYDEEKATYVSLENINLEIANLNEELQKSYQEIFQLRNSGKETVEDFSPWIEKIKFLKMQLLNLQKIWEKKFQNEKNEESYALWHQKENSIYNLVTDYGDQNCVYIIPSEIGKKQISIFSNLPIPRESWDDCLVALLARYGVVIKSVTPWLKELSIVGSSSAEISGVVFNEVDLQLLSEKDYICYILSPFNPDIHLDYQVLQKFVNTEAIQLDIVAGQIFIYGTVRDIASLLNLYNSVKKDALKQDFQLITLSKLDAFEMISVLKAAFQKEFSLEDDSNLTSLKIIPLESRPQTLCLVGSKVLVQKALRLIENIEDKVDSPSDKIVFLYDVKYSSPDELAMLLSKVYDTFSQKGVSIFTDEKILNKSASNSAVSNTSISSNFIVDSKTSTLIMVVEREVLPHLKSLIKRIDIPKKIIHLEVLLFERKISNQRKSGLNLLRLGEELTKPGRVALQWSSGVGILEFLLSGEGSSNVPGYDLAYQFLLGQEDVQINASPSIVTMNQTPAKIAIVEEMSILVSSEKDNKTSYNRAQYGITIEILPTVNMTKNQDNVKNYITLDTNISFDTTHKNPNDRPEVTRRHITNHVCIADGETVILGGLRRKNSSDNKEGLPFLGEIPGVGKLFSMTSTSESSTEMFIFITPKIIEDPMFLEQQKKIALLARRPGESSEVVQAFEEGKTNLLQRVKEESFNKASNMFPFCKQLSNQNNEYDGR